MSTNDVLITPGSGEVKWVDSGGSDFVRIIGDAGATNTITFVGDDNTANGVVFQDHATDVFYPATSGLNLGVSANRWNLFATAGDFSGAITTATNLTLSGASSTITINGASAAINMGGSAGLFTLSSGSSILLSGATSSVTLTGLSSVLTLAGVTGTNLAPLKFTTGSAPGTSVAGQMWWTGGSNLQFAKTNGTASTFAFTDTDLSTFTVGILGVARGGTGTGTSFTTGSIVFAGGSGVYTQDNANLFFDDTNNTLGVGTTRTGAISGTNPSVRILGTGTTSATSSFEVQNSSAGVLFFVRNDGLINFGTKGTYTESTGQLALSTSGSGAGILLGGDVSLYRQAADVLRTDDAVWVNSRIAVGADPASYPNSSIRVSKYPGSDAYHRAADFLVWNTSAYTRTTSTAGVLCDHYYGATSDNAAGLYGGVFNMVVQATKNTGTISNVAGGSFIVVWSATTTATGDDISAARITLSSSSATANITTAYGIKNSTSITSGFTITNLHGVYTIGPVAATGTITNYNGLYVATPTSATITTHCGLYIEDLGIGTNRYAIYLAGTSGAARQGITWNGDVNLYRSAADTLKTDDSLVVARALNTGVSTLSDGATPALDASLGNTFLLTAAGDRTIAVPTNAVSGQKITIVHKASGGARTLSLNTGAGGFRFGTDITALTSTTSGLTDYIGAIYNAADSKWDIVSYVKGF